MFKGGDIQHWISPAKMRTFGVVFLEWKPCHSCVGMCVPPFPQLKHKTCTVATLKTKSSEHNKKVPHRKIALQTYTTFNNH